MLVCAVVYCRSVQAEWSNHRRITSSAWWGLWQFLWSSDSNKSATHCQRLPSTKQHTR